MSTTQLNVLIPYKHFDYLSKIGDLSKRSHGFKFGKALLAKILIEFLASKNLDFSKIQSEQELREALEA